MFLDHLFWLIKKIFQSVILVLHFEESITCNFFDWHCFRTIKQKAYLLFEKFNKRSNLIIGFVSALILFIDIYSGTLFF